MRYKKGDLLLLKEHFRLLASYERQSRCGLVVQIVNKDYMRVMWANSSGDPWFENVCFIASTNFYERVS